MKNTTHRVVILKDVNSDLISQAIIFLKSSEDIYDSTALYEAEKIVEKFMENGYLPEQKKRLNKNWIYTLAAFTIALVAMGCVFLLKTKM